uniref:Uncharacterized protein n=1 Tax=Rhizophora mucronata TaxID=61149 RepID=A0A2P2PI41_RHIMU
MRLREKELEDEDIKLSLLAFWYFGR